jgi:aspartate-semialdehyde dehydrogenase
MKKVGIVGARGAVGSELLLTLHKRKFPVSAETLFLFGSERGAGTTVETPFGPKEIELFSLEKMSGLDVVFLAVSGEFAKENARKIAEQGAVVIDNSSAFRLVDDVPLIIPEINPEQAKGAKLISNPNCTTAILAVALYPLHQNFGVKKCIVSTYQATSGAGAEAMEELRVQTRNYLDGKEVTHEKFLHPIPFNLIPQIDVFQDNGYTKEEMKVTLETRKIFGEPNFQLSCTAVRIPTFRAHSESVTIETEKKISPDEARQILEKSPGVRLVDDPTKSMYPIFGECGLDFFVCGDQLLKGAALNAVQIAELL